MLKTDIKGKIANFSTSKYQFLPVGSSRNVMERALPVKA